MARTTAQAYRRLVTPFGSPVTMFAKRAERLLEADLALYERMLEVGSPPSFLPYLEG